VGGALLLFGKAAAGFALFAVITGLVEIAKHRAEVLEALSPTAREVSKLRH
jgi:hypothetical protein